MHYREDDVVEMQVKVADTRFHYYELTMQIASFASNLSKERAREYMHQGVNRRLGILHRCFENIFRLFPPDQMEKLSGNNRIDIEINLHAFLINIYGIIENIGLALAHENELIPVKSERKGESIGVNLFKMKFSGRLNPKLKEYLVKPKIQEWYRNYAKNYRDALAHRIPPYVPPAALNKEQQRQYEDIDRELQKAYSNGNYDQIEVLQEKQASLGRSNPLFMHSFSEKATPMYLHPQMIADFGTIEELLKTAITNFYSKTDNERGG
ncbi:MAG: hypothetical protein WCH07_09260 [Deltaproteobacteria bacterium]